MKKSFIFMACAALVLCSCEKEVKQGTATSGDLISFSAEKIQTKTVYDSSNELQINWTEGDQVKIFCAEAEDVTESTYAVSSPVDNKKHWGKLSLVSGGGLKWGGDLDVHHFFSVYPANSAVSVENGIATFNVNKYQVCTVNNSGDNLVADPDMNNAFMVAHVSTEPVDNVEIHYNPIMTTLKITVKGKTAGSQASTTVTGVSITSKTATYGSTFSYDIAAGKILETASQQTSNVYVEVKNGDDNFVDLAAGQTLTLTAFIPPVDVTAKDPIQVRLHAQNSEELTVTLGKTNDTKITASSKRLIELPNVKNQEVNGNNWITPLDDDIYVSQLSIPGAHDAATGDGTTFALGKTQEKTLDQQFEMGIRAFDLRPTVKNNDIIIAHGAVATSFNWDNIMERFKFYLSENPDEFIIITMRHEDEYDNNNANWGSLMMQKLSTIKSAINPSTGDSYTVDFKPNLTVGEMRGKILFLCRDWTKYNESGPTVGGYTGWGHSKEGAEVAIYGPDGSRGTMNLQDCYSPGEAGLGLFTYGQYPSIKWNAIKKLLDLSSQFHTNPDMVNRWSINHTSGYTSLVSTTGAYRENAANNNIQLYNTITAADWEGSTGIILSDFVGARTSGAGGILEKKYTVYGDLLPQAIINNNYKYHLKRKGE